MLVKRTMEEELKAEELKKLNELLTMIKILMEDELTEVQIQKVKIKLEKLGIKNGN